jgi:hypothetical protein
MRIRVALLTGLLAALVAVAPAVAITNGTPDAQEHPYVGELLLYDPDAPSSVFADPGGWFTCSGTLVSSTVVLTAGHCTFGVGLDGGSTTTGTGDGSGGNDIWIDFGEAAHFDGFPPTSSFTSQQARYEARVAWLNASGNWHRGTSHPHPAFDNAAFFLHDAGVVVLDTPISMPKYGRIAGLNYLQRYAPAPRNDHRFEVVGYGLEKVLPKADFGGDTRRKSEPKLNTIQGTPKLTYILLSNNQRTGGTCFGDSGGPTFDNTSSNLVVGVTSFGFSPNCTGVGGVYRIDQPDDLAFLAGFGIRP